MAERKHADFDLETAGRIAGCRVLSIGAVLFDRNGVDMETFYVRIDPALWVEGTYKDDPDTLAWWANQNRKVYEEAWGGKTPPYEAFAMFRKWIAQHDPAVIWALGSSFDTAMTDYWLDHFDLEPLPYRRKLCQRGWAELAGVDRIHPPEAEAHNALTDARYQAMTQQAALTKLKAWDLFEQL